jgi:hypothetical protein
VIFDGIKSLKKWMVAKSDGGSSNLKGVLNELISKLLQNHPICLLLYSWMVLSCKPGYAGHQTLKTHDG